MRRGALFNLEWRDLDWRERLITLRGAAAKSGKTAVIPLSEYARMVLLGVQRTESPLVFPGKDGGPRVNISRFAKRIHKRAHLPEGFRLLHGLRHTYASWLASSGEVDLYLLQKMLTHGSPQMTQRYADIADRAKRRASKVMDECVHQAVNAEPVPEPTGAKVVPFGGKRR
jgi:integrase